MFMKFCKTCDLYIDKNVNYCGECGTKLTDVDMSPTTAISPDFKQNAYVKKFSYKEIKIKREAKGVVEKYGICDNCNKTFNTKDLTQCGPCGNFFCNNCWEDHRWCHGKAPAAGIEYHSDGSFSGFDGSERLK